MQCKKGMHFSLDFSWYSVHLDIVRLRLMGCSVWEGGEGGEGLLNRQIPVSVTKCIC